MVSNAGGSELFSSYEQDFTSVTDSIKAKIEQQIPNQKGGRYIIYLHVVLYS
jgi:vesicle transport through interaction with t-SNAREs protein 1